MNGTKYVAAGYYEMSGSGELTEGEDGVWEIEITNTLETGKLKIDKAVFVDGTDKTSSYMDIAKCWIKCGRSAV